MELFCDDEDSSEISSVTESELAIRSSDLFIELGEIFDFFNNDGHRRQRDRGNQGGNQGTTSEENQRQEECGWKQ